MALIADRFVRSPEGEVIDLATGMRVLVIRRMVMPRDEEAWVARCAAMARVWHSHLTPLIDYVRRDEMTGLEFYGPPRVWMAKTGAAERQESADVVASVGAFLRHCGMEAAGLHVLASADGSWWCVIPGEETGRPCVIADRVAVDPWKPERNGVRSLGLRMAPAVAAYEIARAFEESRANDVRRHWIDAPPGAGLTRMLADVARFGRQAGLVPVGVTVDPWRERSWAGGWLSLLTGRSVVLLGGRPVTDRWDSALALSLRLAAVCAQVRAVVRWVREKTGWGTVQLPATTISGVAEQLWLSPDVAPKRSEATRALVRSCGARPGTIVQRWLSSGYAASSSGAGRALAHVADRPADGHAWRAPAVAYREGGREQEDVRLSRGLARVERLIEIRRWAHALRQLRALLAACERRGRACSGTMVDVLLALGRLALWRTHVTEASTWFQRAGDVVGRLSTDVDRAAAVHWGIGVAALEAADLDRAERVCRLALTEADRIEPSLSWRLQLLLWRTLFWQGRWDEIACARAPPLDHPNLIVAQHRWQSRVALARGVLSDAARHLAQAFVHHESLRDRDGGQALQLDAVRFQLALGDRRAAMRHLSDAKRGGAMPARAWRIRWMGLHLGGGVRQAAQASASARLLERQGAVLLAVRYRYLAGRSDRKTAEVRRFVARYGHGALGGGVCGGTRHAMWDDLETMVRMCHETFEEGPALAKVCGFLRERLVASQVSIYGGSPVVGRLASDGAARIEALTVAESVLDSGVSAPARRLANAVEAAEPIRYAGRTIGAVGCRWALDVDTDEGRASELLRAAAVATAPHVLSAIERQKSPALVAHGGSPFVLLGDSRCMQELRWQIGRVAETPFEVLIEGESGSGKELVARTVHHHSRRRARRFCAVNCAALTDELFEAELFGHARGAFTGALTERAGIFEEAHEGTLFLDEVGELSARAQAKLLRVLQESEVRRVGENLPRRVDVRVIAATNRCLQDEVTAGRFRLDLFYRLDVVRLIVPPLRARPEDVPLLAVTFWEEAMKMMGRRAVLADETIAGLARYHWPGNVRELQNVISAMAVHAPMRGRLGPEFLPLAVSRLPPQQLRLDETRRAHDEAMVREALARAAGNRALAAKSLGLSRQGLAKLMIRLGLRLGAKERALLEGTAVTSFDESEPAIEQELEEEPEPSDQADEEPPVEDREEKDPSTRTECADEEEGDDGTVDDRVGPGETRPVGTESGDGRSLDQTPAKRNGNSGDGDEDGDAGGGKVH